MVKNTKSINGQELRDFRKSMGWSQRELAGMIHVSQSVVSHYELGKLHTPRKFSVAELEELCKSIATEKVPNKPRAKYTRKKKYVAGQIMPDGGIVDNLCKWVIYQDGTSLSIKEYEKIKDHNDKQLEKVMGVSYKPNSLENIKSMILNQMANAIENNKLDDLIKLCNSYNLLK